MPYYGMTKQVQVFDGNGVGPLQWGVGRPSFRLTGQQSKNAHEIVNKTRAEWTHRVEELDLPKIVKAAGGKRWNEGDEGDEELVLSQCIELNESLEDLANGLGGTGGILRSHRNLAKKIREAIKRQYEQPRDTR